MSMPPSNEAITIFAKGNCQDDAYLQFSHQLPQLGIFLLKALDLDAKHRQESAVYEGDNQSKYLNARVKLQTRSKQQQNETFVMGRRMSEQSRYIRSGT